MDDCARSIESMRAVEQVLRNGATDAEGAKHLPGITITRRGPDGFTIFPAQETTRLVPGDVVKVNSAPEPGRLATMGSNDHGAAAQERGEARN